ncbi:hypothetical protein GNI_010380 [Gregarina niphandrodes]|uniref:Uncharacterized protein n=1 Tax=Gregarina niphandrodes TaxID=110365 RepID=A0A023BD61_GRENI|nr:hypothetical protein GNI_010380 [Gregarina niphandrodes]EZG86311.1 hypothetical protein GNI_010380 [Gregarina niphandrodes]|eukprot:XP_011128762.1 hypothetical protein GNI_010380 [Gregarina niphandrodes]
MAVNILGKLTASSNTVVPSRPKRVNRKKNDNVYEFIDYVTSVAQRKVQRSYEMERRLISDPTFRNNYSMRSLVARQYYRGYGLCKKLLDDEKILGCLTIVGRLELGIFVYWLLAKSLVKKKHFVEAASIFDRIVRLLTVLVRHDSAKADGLGKDGGLARNGDLAAHRLSKDVVELSSPDKGPGEDGDTVALVALGGGLHQRENSSRQTEQRQLLNMILDDLMLCKSNVGEASTVTGGSSSDGGADKRGDQRAIKVKVAIETLEELYAHANQHFENAQMPNIQDFGFPLADACFDHIGEVMTLEQLDIVLRQTLEQRSNPPPSLEGLLGDLSATSAPLMSSELCRLSLALLLVRDLLDAHRETVLSILQSLEPMVISNLLFQNRQAVDRITERFTLETTVKRIKDARQYLSHKFTKLTSWVDMPKVSLMLQNLESTYISLLLLCHNQCHQAYAVAKLVCQRTAGPLKLRPARFRPSLASSTEEFLKLLEKADMESPTGEVRALCLLACLTKPAEDSSRPDPWSTPEFRPRVGRGAPVSYQTAGVPQPFSSTKKEDDITYRLGNIERVGDREHLEETPAQQFARKRSDGDSLDEVRNLLEPVFGYKLPCAAPPIRFDLDPYAVDMEKALKGVKKATGS